MYDSILVPLDGSKRAEKILPHVEKMANCFDAKMILLEVVAPVYYVMDPQVSYLDINLEETKYRLSEARAYLETLAAEIESRGLKVEAYVEQGPVVDMIIQFARKKGTEIIAMASHGRSGLGRVFYGSVSAGVLQQVDRPILLVRSRDDE